jgi:hypothetical protein
VYVIRINDGILKLFYFVYLFDCNIYFKFRQPVCISKGIMYSYILCYLWNLILPINFYKKYLFKLSWETSKLYVYALSLEKDVKCYFSSDEVVGGRLP